MTKFTTADADRLLGLADQFMEDWALSAIESGEPDRDYEERNAEWEEIRPLLVQAPALLKALTDALFVLDANREGSGPSKAQAITQIEALIAKAGRQQ